MVHGSRFVDAERSLTCTEIDLSRGRSHAVRHHAEHAKGKVSADGTSFHATLVIEISDLAGQVLFSTQGTAVGSKIRVDQVLKMDASGALDKAPEVSIFAHSPFRLDLSVGQVVPPRW